MLGLGYPLLSFAWVLSLLVYIFHYDTTIGDNVRYNVRSVKRVPVFSWILMNFNEHATHHQFPNIAWYELPEKQKELPEYFKDKNQNTWNFFKAILNQLKGPHIHYEI
jgi:fatty acid desaturase